MHPECDKHATDAVSWFPFDVHHWDGKSEPVYSHLYSNPPTMLQPSDAKHFAVPVVVWTWCGAPKCKGEMILAMMLTFAASSIKYHLTGGMVPYCVRCGLLCPQDVLVVHDFLPYCNECSLIHNH
jgi:hypothetical protein